MSNSTTTASTVRQEGVLGNLAALISSRSQLVIPTEERRGVTHIPPDKPPRKCGSVGIMGVGLMGHGCVAKKTGLSYRELIAQAAAKAYEDAGISPCDLDDVPPLVDRGAGSKVAINGFGSIGRLCLASAEKSSLNFGLLDWTREQLDAVFDTAYAMYDDSFESRNKYSVANSGVGVVTDHGVHKYLAAVGATFYSGSLCSFRECGYDDFVAEARQAQEAFWDIAMGITKTDGHAHTPECAGSYVSSVSTFTRWYDTGGNIMGRKIQDHRQTDQSSFTSAFGAPEVRISYEDVAFAGDIAAAALMPESVERGDLHGMRGGGRPNPGRPSFDMRFVPNGFHLHVKFPGFSGGAALPVCPNQGQQGLPGSSLASMLYGAFPDWPAVELVAVDGHILAVRTPVGWRRFHYTDLGFAREDNREPTEAWALLADLCRKKTQGRRLPPDRVAAIKQQMSGLRKKLRQLFGLDGDPFHNFHRQHGWIPKFRCREGVPGDDDRFVAGFHPEE